MGAGSSAERSSQDGATAAGESQPSSPEAETPTAALAEQEQLEDAAKLLQKNGQISTINGTAEEQVELNLKPEELNGQQAEEVVADGKETSTVVGDLTSSCGKGKSEIGTIALVL
ncbi:A-kinase anchor protein 12-like [Eublepharis macularius]|uniref:A-kinase anchor protein 12-like n=1 Tax=Eublepharis macularius TaxID=481883 RepID=A0AA97IYC0_EUBMA|nr:A-kinase anchor protein 12-like [Eublepharis macularius]